MTHVPLVEVEAITSARDRGIYEHVAKVRGGRMGNVFKALANSPGALEKVAAVGEFCRFQAGLEPGLRELVILTVAQEARCSYEWTHHWPLAAKAGVAEDILGRIGSSSIEEEHSPMGPALRYARLTTTAQPVDTDTVAKLRAALGDGGLVELVTLVGYYGMLGRMINTLGVPLEDGVEERSYLTGHV